MKGKRSRFGFQSDADFLKNDDDERRALAMPLKRNAEEFFPSFMEFGVAYCLIMDLLGPLNEFFFT